ncbi:hypothetical protein COV15_03360 [Candidatus Woesearchaeota archaeon CG10_big_fil_rev_8_21_14_0_10_34_12]|nr:MAG: hypothetical protein COV15_03360 [Candidatus Woesearchaeota archaeon CG10_big_fil_rev_8_21_14_0_10_34_12]
MSKRIKRLEKQERGLLKQAEKHKIKAETEVGRKDTTKDYWIGEADRFEIQARKRAEIIRKLKRDKETRKDEDSKENNLNK